MMREHAVPSASNGSARRHRVAGGRGHQVKIRFTDEEYAALAARAADAGVSVQRFLADGAIARRPVRAAPSALVAELAALRRLSANLAGNMNQIARRLNSGAVPDARIPAACDAVVRTTRRLDAALAWLGIPVPRNAAAGPEPPAGRRIADPEPGSRRSGRFPGRSAARNVS